MVDTLAPLPPSVGATTMASMKTVKSFVYIVDCPAFPGDIFSNASVAASLKGRKQKRKMHTCRFVDEEEEEMVGAGNTRIIAPIFLTERPVRC